MKKSILFAAVFFIGATAFSQDTSTTRPMQGEKMNNHMGMHKMKDCIMMENGKPMVMKNGESTALDQDMTLPNGTVVMADGMVKMKNGTSKTLKNGDCVYMDGTMGRMPMMHDKDKMKMKKDSTKM